VFVRKFFATRMNSSSEETPPDFAAWQERAFALVDALLAAVAEDEEDSTALVKVAITPSHTLATPVRDLLQLFSSQQHTPGSGAPSVLGKREREADATDDLSIASAGAVLEPPSEPVTPAAVGTASLAGNDATAASSEDWAKELRPTPHPYKRRRIHSFGGLGFDEVACVSRSSFTLPDVIATLSKGTTPLLQLVD